MTAQWIDYKPTPRDRLISKAQHGELSAQEAEQEAARAGYEPFEFAPEWPAYNPCEESRWSLPMALAWIAWRDLKGVRDNDARFRAKCRHWIFREWTEPTDGGKKFTKRKGWFLEYRPRPTIAELSFTDKNRRSKGTLPETAQMSVSDAEKALWRALSDGYLVAEAMSSVGQPVEIPLHKWPYLKLTEVRGHVVLQYDPNDASIPYTEVKLKQNALMRLWPEATNIEAMAIAGDYAIAPSMLGPMNQDGDAGYVPFCVALHWIMSDRGTKPVRVNDKDAWQSAVSKLIGSVCSGEIDLIGIPFGKALAERMPEYSLAAIRVLPPVSNSIEDILHSRAHLVCWSYDNLEHWQREFNDQIFEQGDARATWTHLQVNKSGILSKWPRPATSAKKAKDCRQWLVAQMLASPDCKPKPKESYLEEAKAKFPRLSNRQFLSAWSGAIDESGASSWASAGRLPTKSNRRTK